MPQIDDVPILPQAISPYAIRAAVEGIPVSAIARILARPSEEVFETIREGLYRGEVAQMPPADWPPTAKLADHLPAVTVKVTDDDMMFACRQKLGLTNLEAAFFLLLLKSPRADKDKLHHVIETQRMRRASTPDKMEITDPKMVDVMICKLRKKLKNIDPKIKIITVWGGGYYLDPGIKESVMGRLGLTGSEDDGRRPVGEREPPDADDSP